MQEENMRILWNEFVGEYKRGTIKRIVPGRYAFIRGASGDVYAAVSKLPRQAKVGDLIGYRLDPYEERPTAMSVCSWEEAQKINDSWNRWLVPSAHPCTLIKNWSGDVQVAGTEGIISKGVHCVSSSAYIAFNEYAEPTLAITIAEANRSKGVFEAFWPDDEWERVQCYRAARAAIADARASGTSRTAEFMAAEAALMAKYLRTFLGNKRGW